MTNEKKLGPMDRYLNWAPTWLLVIHAVLCPVIATGVLYGMCWFFLGLGTS